MIRLLVLSLVSGALLTGCDMLGGGEAAEKAAAQREAESKAIGGACRHAGRAIEDCFALNKRADKAAVFAGWREMNDYMRENKIDPVAPTLTAQSQRSETPAPAAKNPADAEVKPKPKRPES